MGRESLPGAASTRTVNEDLADDNTSGHDTVYSFERVWAKLRSQGWSQRDEFFIKPGKDIGGVEDQDYFYGEAAVCMYATEIALLEGEDSEPASPGITMTQDQAPTESGMKSHQSSVGGTTSDQASAASRSTEKRHGVKGSAAKRESEKRVKNEDTVKTEVDAAKPSGSGKQKAKRAVEIAPRQWPDSHPRKGRHEADAICLFDSDDDDDDDNDGDDEAGGLEEKARAVQPKVENVNVDEDEVKRTAAGKRAYIEEEEEEEEADHDGDEYIDYGEDFDSGDSSTRQTKRQKLTTQLKEKQKHSVPHVGSSPMSRSSNAKNHYEPIRMTGRKGKTSPRGLIPSPQRRNRESEPTTEHPPVQQSPPPSAVPKPCAAQGLASQFDEAAIKPEPLQGSTCSPLSPPARPASRTSSVASSHQTYTVPPMASPPTQSTDSGPIVRLAVDGVTFKSFPEQKYRVVIAEDPESSETTIVMEERTTKAQMKLAYFDISTFSEPPKSVHATPQPSALVYQALSLLLKRVCETIAVDNPPYGVASEDDGSPFGDFDLVREDSSTVIVMEFPNIGWLAQVHRFPMVMVQESPRVQALSTELEHTKQAVQTLSTELERTKEELVASRRERGAFKQQDEKRKLELESAQRSLEALQKQHEKQRQELEAARKVVEASRVDCCILHHKLKGSRQDFKAFKKEKDTIQQKLEASQRNVEAFKKENEKLQQKLKASEQDIEAFKKQLAQLERQHEKERKAAEQQQQQSPNGATTPPLQPAATAPRPPVDAVPVVVPVAGPSPRGKDTVTFHGQSSWLGTAHPNDAVIADKTTWALSWERIVESSDNHYELVTTDATSTVVKLLKRGSYQLNLNVIHRTNWQLVVTISSTQSHSHQLKPTTIQVIETKNKTMHRSRIDQIIECDVDDTVAVQLQSRSETNPLHGKAIVVKSLTAQPNKWLMQFIDGQFLLAGESNGVAANQ